MGRSRFVGSQHARALPGIYGPAPECEPTGGGSMKPISARLTIAGVLLAIAVSACAVVPAPGYEGVVAYEAPPPARFEVVGVAPAPAISECRVRGSGRAAATPGIPASGRLRGPAAAG